MLYNCFMAPANAGQTHTQSEYCNPRALNIMDHWHWYEQALVPVHTQSYMHACWQLAVWALWILHMPHVLYFLQCLWSAIKNCDTKVFDACMQHVGVCAH